MWLYKDLLVKILLGNQWLECVDFVGMYAFATVFSIVTNSFFSELYRSKGKPKISMLAQIIYLAFLIPAVILASKSGFNALCITITVAVYGFFVVHYCLAKRFFGIELRKLVGNIFSPLLASGAMAIFSLAVQAVSQNIVIRIISAALCVPVYLLAILLQPSLRSFLETNEFTADTYKKLKNKLWKNKLDQ
jgi:PST family polysaccharide transporter